jgi:hypothetical protein
MNKVVIYTPAEDFWYNSDIGPAMLMWFIAVGLAFFVTYPMLKPRGNRNPNFYIFLLVAGCVTYTIHYGIIWLLTNV